VDVRDGQVTGAARDGSDGFLVSLADATRVRARRLVVTTGLVDELLLADLEAAAARRPAG